MFYDILQPLISHRVEPDSYGGSLRFLKFLATRYDRVGPAQLPNQKVLTQDRDSEILHGGCHHYHPKLAVLTRKNTIYIYMYIYIYTVIKERGKERKPKLIIVLVYCECIFVIYLIELMRDLLEICAENAEYRGYM